MMIYEIVMLELYYSWLVCTSSVTVTILLVVGLENRLIILPN